MNSDEPSVLSRAYAVEQRPWGAFVTLEQSPMYWVKRIIVKPGQRLSLQAHAARNEVWTCIAGLVYATIGDKERPMRPGDVVRISAGTKHRLSSSSGGTIIEIATGAPDEEDIERFEDDYGRT